MYMGLEVMLSFYRCLAVFLFPLNILQKFILSLTERLEKLLLPILSG